MVFDEGQIQHPGRQSSDLLGGIDLTLKLAPELDRWSGNEYGMFRLVINPIISCYTLHSSGSPSCGTATVIRSVNLRV